MDIGTYLPHLYYDLSKAAAIRTTYGMGVELARRGLAAAVARGCMRTERVLEHHARHPVDRSATELPEYVGRGVAALAEDPNVVARSGQLFAVGDLAREYGFTDIDVRQPLRFEITGDTEPFWNRLAP